MSNAVKRAVARALARKEGEAADLARQQYRARILASRVRLLDRATELAAALRAMDAERQRMGGWGEIVQPISQLLAIVEQDIIPNTKAILHQDMGDRQALMYRFGHAVP